MAGTTSPAAFTIRPLEAADQAWLSAYLVAQWQSEVVVAHDTVYEVKRLPGFVAESGGEPVGLLTYQIEGDNCEIVTIDCRHQRRGIGGALIARAAAAAREQGCRRLWLVTTNDNLDALRFYQRRGFRLEAVDPGAVNRARLLKPSIPLVGEYGILLRDEIRLGMKLTGTDDD